MKRIVRLTESDLVRLVKRVISEQATDIANQNFSQGANGAIIPVFASNGLATFSGGRVVLTSIGNKVFAPIGNVGPNGERTGKYLKVQVTAA